MLDTVKLQSPKLGEALAAEIERSCVRKSAQDLGTGELLYELTTGSLSGSWDSRVSVRVLREEWAEVRASRIEMDALGDFKPRVTTQMRPCEPYLVIEGSVHKAMLGHNVSGGPEALRAPCEWLVADLGARLGVDLPDGSEWLLRRADWAECYELPDYEAVEEYVWGLNSAEYPRRSVARYGRESIFAAGRSTAVKAYHKGPEFSKHDHRRLRGIMQESDLLRLQLRANSVLRWEVSVKAKKLDEDHGAKPRVSEISADYLRRLHYREVRRLVREGEAEVQTVRKQKDVRDRLLSVYNDRKAGILLGTWHQLVTLGEKETRRHIPQRTWYRHKRELAEAGVSWIGADVLVVPRVSSLPVDFSPTERDPRRTSGEDPVVTQKLAALRAA